MRTDVPAELVGETQIEPPVFGGLKLPPYAGTETNLILEFSAGRGEQPAALRHAGHVAHYLLTYAEVGAHVELDGSLGHL